MARKKKDKHHNWLGDKATQKAGNSRAYRLFPIIGPCETCGNEKSERHHKDGNTLNNDPTNIEILCHGCHMREHQRRGDLRQPTKLSDADVVEIRKLHNQGVSRKIISEMFDVTQCHISAVVNYRKRGNVDPHNRGKHINQCRKISVAEEVEIFNRYRAGEKPAAIMKDYPITRTNFYRIRDKYLDEEWINHLDHSETTSDARNAGCP